MRKVLQRTEKVALNGEVAIIHHRYVLETMHWQSPTCDKTQGYYYIRLHNTISWKLKINAYLLPTYIDINWCLYTHQTCCKSSRQYNDILGTPTKHCGRENAFIRTTTRNTLFFNKYYPMWKMTESEILRHCLAMDRNGNQNTVTFFHIFFQLPSPTSINFEYLYRQMCFPFTTNLNNISKTKRKLLFA